MAQVVNYDPPQVPEDFIHRVGRTGRVGTRGTASTFSTRTERGEINKIEKLLNIRLTRRDVAPNVAREERHSAPVIVMPSSARPSQSFHFKSKRRSSR